jgi:hypothetical protein
MKLGESGTQLVVGAAIVALILVMFYLDIPNDVTLFGLAVMPPLWTVLTVIGAALALLLVFRGWTGGAVTEAGVFAAALVPLFVITQTHEFILLRAVNFLAVIADLSVIVLVLARRARTKVSP